MHCLHRCTFLTMLAHLFVTVGLAAEPAGDAKSAPNAVTAKPAADKPIDAAADASDGASSESNALREQTIYVPYEKLRQVFEQHGRGVFLPYEKFQELWQAAQRHVVPPQAAKPPVPALITEMDAEANAAKDVVAVRATLRIDVLAEGWHEIPLRLGDSAITSAVIAGKPAKVLGDPKQGYRLLLQKQGKTPEQLELILEFAKAISKAPGQNSVAFQAPEAPVSRWRVRIPESGIKVEIQPMVAASEPPGVKSAKEEQKPTEETVLWAFVGAAPEVRIQWTPKSEGATGMEALASVQTEQQVWITDGVTRMRAKLTYTVSRAELRQLALLLPADQKVVNVFDANVKQWSTKQEKDTQRIDVQLFEPVKQSQVVTLELERYSGEQEKTSALQVPVIKALNVGRQQGIVVVDVGQGLRAEPTGSSGLLQLDAADLPKSLAGAKWAFSYRYAAVPYELVLSLETVKPRVLVEALVEAFLAPERLTLETTLLYRIERAGLFRLEVEIPPGFDVRSVRGRELPGVAAAPVDGYHREGGQKNRLLVDLGRKAIGRVALTVELQRELHEAALTTPTDKSAIVPVPILTLPAGASERTAGRILVHAPEGLRVNPGSSQGLRSISFKDACELIPSTRSTSAAEMRPVLAFAYLQDGAALALEAQRRKPQVTLAQLLVARIEDGVVKYQASFRYNVRYSGVKSLRIDIPKSAASRVRSHTPGIREKEIQPQPNDVAEGCAAWTFTGESELLGDGRIELGWEEGLSGKLELGKPVVLQVPRLIPRDTDRAWGQVVLTKSETIDVLESGEPQGLRPIDPQRDLMPGANVPGAARAFEFHEDWSLAVAATRYQLEEVKRTSIERAVVQMVLTSAEQVSVRALYRMRSARQRLELELPAKVQFDTEPVRINGRPLGLERGQQGQLRTAANETQAFDQFFVPLVDPNSDEGFLLEVRYLVPRNGGRLDLPNFAGEPAAQKVYLCVYLPPQKVLVEKRGPWTEEFSWQWIDGDWKPVPAHSDAKLIEWVSQGLPQSGRDEVFQTDRNLYVFSNLHPAPPPEGSLYLDVVRDTWLSAVVVAGAVLLGILLLPAGRGTRAFWLGVALVALVLCGLFAPLMAWQVADGKLMAGLLIVAVIWAVQYVAGSLRRRPPGNVPATPAPCAESVVVSVAEPPGSEPAPGEPKSPPEQREGGTSHE